MAFPISTYEISQLYKPLDTNIAAGKIFLSCLSKAAKKGFFSGPLRGGWGKGLAAKKKDLF